MEKFNPPNSFEWRSLLFPFYVKETGPQKFSYWQRVEPGLEPWSEALRA